MDSTQAPHLCKKKILKNKTVFARKKLQVKEQDTKYNIKCEIAEMHGITGFSVDPCNCCWIEIISFRLQDVKARFPATGVSMHR